MATLKQLQANRAGREKKLRERLTKNALRQVEWEVTRLLDTEEYEQERSELTTLIFSLKDKIIKLAGKSAALRESLFSLPTPCYPHDTPVPCALLFRIEGYNDDRHPTWGETPESKYFLGDVFYLTITGDVVKRLEEGPGHDGDKGAEKISRGNYTIHNSVFAWVAEALQRVLDDAKARR